MSYWSTPQYSEYIKSNMTYWYVRSTSTGYILYCSSKELDPCPIDTTFHHVRLNLTSFLCSHTQHNTRHWQFWNLLPSHYDNKDNDDNVNRRISPKRLQFLGRRRIATQETPSFADTKLSGTLKDFLGVHVLCQADLSFSHYLCRTRVSFFIHSLVCVLILILILVLVLVLVLV